MAKFFRILGLIVTVAVCAIVALALYTYEAGNVRQTPEAADERVVQSVAREEQIVLLSLGIQGIREDSNHLRVRNYELPGTARVQFIQYDYRAKLGINGKDVVVEPVGDGEYKVTIPRFEFLGHSDAHFKTVVEDNGALSFLTDDVDTAAAITEILNDDTKRKHIADNTDILREQAQAHYRSIIQAAEPGAKVEFSFR